MKNLRHGEKVEINGNKGTVGTSFGFAVASNDSIEQVEEWLRIPANPDFGPNPKAWVSKEATCICSDPGYAARENEKWSSAIKLVDGETVSIDGDFWVVEYMGNFSDMVHFIEV